MCYRESKGNRIMEDKLKSVWNQQWVILNYVLTLKLMDWQKTKLIPWQPKMKLGPSGLNAKCDCHDMVAATANDWCSGGVRVTWHTHLSFLCFHQFVSANYGISNYATSVSFHTISCKLFSNYPIIQRHLTNRPRSAAFRAWTSWNILSSSFRTYLVCFNT
jgi:hypothetical protein